MIFYVDFEENTPLMFIEINNMIFFLIKKCIVQLKFAIKIKNFINIVI